MALYSAKLTIAADNTPQALTDAILAAAGIPLSKSKAAMVFIYSESTNNAAAVSRFGGAQVHRGNSIGGAINPGDTALIPGTGVGNPHDVKTTYVSGKQNDVYNYTWLTQ